MAGDDDTDIEFLHNHDDAPVRDAAGASEENLALTARLSNRRIFVLLTVVVVVTAGLAVLHDDTETPVTSPSPAPATPSSASRPATATSIAANPDRDRKRSIVLAEQQLCPSCRVTSAPDLRRPAAQALGSTLALQTRREGRARGVVVAATFADRAQLLVIVTPYRHLVEPTRLGIVPPLGVQTQRNGAVTLTAIASGSKDAVSLLGRPAIQGWLATFRSRTLG